MLKLWKWLCTVLILGLAVGLSGCALIADQENTNSQKTAVLTGFNEVAEYISKHGKLPDNFITKNEARKLGWEPQKGNLPEVAPGKSIGGDVFRNREGLLPKKNGRIWYEADINYKKGTRGSDRIVFSNDGLIYKTTDHYKTFTPM
ncbi:guanyl-specific ribonuclease Sa [Paenibacillus sp. PvR052]|nr:guanyl-specific ribonuclease Sa [Paenibacillus sp. PvP091]MBP1170358.1 guanyl-specific ribonuclease Sa [Paenibacillus sp. PvR098]MBP2441386.1 guanyl-specific ribonuclease Sa [Paenibacillus sp. PvP052]